jgi:transposase InsO family protein
MDRVHAFNQGIIRESGRIPRSDYTPFWPPQQHITDLGTQFTGSAFWDFCDERSIVVKYVLVAHPGTNGQVERANGMILDALKKRLYRENDKAPGRWLKELPSVVWGL